jgi:hypothetical protein
LSCSDCMINKVDCMACHQKYSKADHVERFTKNKLHELKFTCHGCNQEHAYENMIQHQKICESFKPKAKCPLCKQPNIEGITKHLETDCPKREVNCEKCTIKIIGDEEHDCVKELLTLLDKV